MTIETKNLQEVNPIQKQPTHPGEILGPSDPHEVITSGSQLVTFGERITYVFAVGKEVGSIHFDRNRGEIFYKGHNIRNMEIEEWQMQVMEKLRKLLDTDERGKPFAMAYGRLLDKIVLEKKNHLKTF